MWRRSQMVDYSSVLQKKISLMRRIEYGTAMQDLIHEPMAAVPFDPVEALELATFAYDKERPDLAEMWLNVTLSGYQKLSPSKKELYKVLSVVKESEVQKLYKKVKKINKLFWIFELLKKMLWLYYKL
ncbi:uncharacterized protein [Drosophila pseudoobscura]|uniref:Uncharacterized protein isoform X4 n=1 Tax=Drosophila pseudoobscura pseudoobscura TaxID=46245 RepID=A0A6I8VVQ7_DROPS|nr:uncharacterized protein LOC26533096 isoform X4 [Drosophila pseudoobscura]